MSGRVTTEMTWAGGRPEPSRQGYMLATTQGPRSTPSNGTWRRRRAAADEAFIGVCVGTVKPLLTPDRFMPEFMQRAIHNLVDEIWANVMLELPSLMGGVRQWRSRARRQPRAPPKRVGAAGAAARASRHCDGQAPQPAPSSSAPAHRHEAARRCRRRRPPRRRRHQRSRALVVVAGCRGAPGSDSGGCCLAACTDDAPAEAVHRATTRHRHPQAVAGCITRLV